MRWLLLVWYNNMLTVKYMLFLTIEMHNQQKYVGMGKKNKKCFTDGGS